MTKCRLFFLWLITFMLVVFVSCKKENGSGTPVVSLSDTAKSVSENAGTVSLTINLNEAASQSIQLDYELSGTAILNGDYEIDSSSHVTIAAGSTTATVKFTIYDDEVPEAGKTIHIKFSSSASVSFSNAEATITITDNDASQAANGLQTDLTWDAGALVDLDLYVFNNVTIDANNNITGYDVVRGSEHDKGFESVLIYNSDADGVYYIAVSYYAGSRSVNYSLNFNGPNITNETANDSFSTSDVGGGLLFGPITKSGSSYSRQRGSLFNLKDMKSYIYRGKIK